MSDAGVRFRGKPAESVAMPGANVPVFPPRSSGKIRRKTIFGRADL
jgi:hypothetical protein